MEAPRPFGPGSAVSGYRGAARAGMAHTMVPARLNGVNAIGRMLDSPLTTIVGATESFDCPQCCGRGRHGPELERPEE